MFDLFDIAALLIYLAVVVGIVAGIIAVERVMIKREKLKIALLLPFVVFAVLIIIILPKAATSGKAYTSNCDNVSIWNDSGKDLGSIDVIIDGKRNILDFGPFITNEDQNTQYLDLEFDNGKLIGTRDALKYSEKIEKAFKDHSFKNRPDGISSSYSRVNNQKKSIVDERYSQSDAVSRVFILIYVLPLPLVMLIMYYKAYRKRKKKINYNRSRIADL